MNLFSRWLRNPDVTSPDSSETVDSAESKALAVALDDIASLQTELAEYKTCVAQITTVVAAGARGDMENRLRLSHDIPELHDLACELNRFMDMTDAFVRESGAALDYAARGKFFRRVITRGMHGAFANGAGLINRAADEMAAQAGLIEKARADQLQLADQFEHDVIGMVTSVAAAAKQLQETSKALAAASLHATGEASEVTRLSEQATQSVHRAMEATSGFKRSLAIVEGSVAVSTDVSREAVGKSNEASEIVSGLSEDSNRIGGVVKIISQVAEQTNLLALNATIEAARAGEAGKGFAVVASEVKNLANQTGRATQQISDDIKAVQGATANAVDAITVIRTTIDKLQEVSDEVVRAIEVQQAANTEITTEMHATEDGCVQVTERIAGVSSAAEKASNAADQVLQSASDLTSLATELESSVQGFLGGIRG